jgi:hypothetical protein
LRALNSPCYDEQFETMTRRCYCFTEIATKTLDAVVGHNAELEVSPMG